jgi:prepilin-type N-terminal cleavage/methylation domain-containing protein
MSRLHPYPKKESGIKKEPAGFTLIEVLVSAVILLVALLPTITAFSVGHTDLVYDGKMARAIALAEQNMEQIKTSAATTAGFTALAGNTATNGIFNVSRSVTNVGFGAAASDLRRVSVLVTWPESARPGRYEIVGFISKPY